METQKYECENCSHLWLESELAEVTDLAERLEEGDTVPAGQCPDEDCGAFCHKENATVTYSDKYLASWAVKEMKGILKRGSRYYGPAWADRGYSEKASYCNSAILDIVLRYENYIPWEEVKRRIKALQAAFESGWK